MTVDVGGDTMSCHPFDGSRKVFGRHVQTLGIVAHITFRSADASSKQSHQLFYDVGCAVSMRICGFPLGMSLEDVVPCGHEDDGSHQADVVLVHPSVG